MINGVHHISIATTRLEAMLGFYRDQLGLSVRNTAVMDPATPAFQAVVGLKDAVLDAAWLRAGNVEIEFFQYRQPAGRPVEERPACDGGLRHICFDVTDIAVEYARLKAAGVRFLSEPQFLPGSKVWSVYARDPDGNIVELQELMPGTTLDAIGTFAPLNKT